LRLEDMEGQEGIWDEDGVGQDHDGGLRGEIERLVRIRIHLCRDTLRGGGRLPFPLESVKK
jgi:hypothetical protein